MLYLEVFVLSFDQIDGVDTNKHFLLCKSVLKELIDRNLGPVTEAVDQQIKNLSKELLIVQVFSIGI